MNLFKQALKNKQPQIGLWLMLSSPYATEICASCGFDWLLIDGEHSPNDVPMLLSSLQAAAAYPSQAVTRVPIGDPVIIKQHMDIGAQTILVPMVDTAAQAADMVRAMRYPPQGMRGVGAGAARVSRWSANPHYLKEANDDACLLVQAETVTAIQNLDAIANTEGVDGVFFGPSDLAASLGHLGNPAHPDVQKVIEDGIRRVVAAGKAPGILTADITLGKRYLELGALFVAVGIDVSVLTSNARALAQSYKAATGTAPAAPKSTGY
jgi:4-hydroxy-2-oxoheptanedioate aldolase